MDKSTAAPLKRRTAATVIAGHLELPIADVIASRDDSAMYRFPVYAITGAYYCAPHRRAKPPPRDLQGRHWHWEFDGGRLGRSVFCAQHHPDAEHIDVDDLPAAASER